MPVAPYGTAEYREWNAARMRRRRRESVPWDRNYDSSERGQFMRRTYVNSPRAYLLRRYREMGEKYGLEPPRTSVADLNRYRDTLRMIERAGGWDMYRVRLGSGL